MRTGDRGLLAATALATLALLSAGAGPAAGSGAHESIVGGGKANPSGWSFVVALEQKRRFFCGGALIAPTKVLTAGHCAKREKLRTLTVLSGSPWISRKRRGERIHVTDRVVEPDYNGPKDERDLAVLTLARPAAATPIPVATRAEEKASTRPGQVLRSAGWGARSPWGHRPAHRLKSVKERVRGARKCQRAYSKRAFQPQSMVCTLGKRIGRLPSRLPFHATSCSGDSGGPLVADTTAGPRLVGVVSVGPFPCGLGAPSIYARTSAGLRFIGGAVAAP